MNAPRQPSRLGTVALSALLLLVSQTALPEDRDHTEQLDSISATIDLKDVDWSTPHGARWLYRRIVSSAKAICWGAVERNGGVKSYSTQVEHARRCFDDSVNSALAHANDATGTDLEQLAGLDRYDEAGLVASASR